MSLRCAAVIVIFSSLFANANTASPDDDGWIPLFNGKNLDGWYSFLLTTGKNSDPKGIFKVENGMIHVLDVNDLLGRRESFGYLATNGEYSDVRIHIEYKWGNKRFPAGSDGKRNSGLMYLFHARDNVWPEALECQIQESDVGDLWLTNGLSVTTWVVDLASSMYSDDNSAPAFQRLVGGPLIHNARVLKAGDFENRAGWNTVEVVIEGDRSTHIVNGRIVNRAWDIKQPDPQNPTQMIPLKTGRILLEAEGAEIWFRNLKIRPLKLAEKSASPVPSSKQNLEGLR